MGGGFLLIVKVRCDQGASPTTDTPFEPHYGTLNVNGDMDEYSQVVDEESVIRSSQDTYAL